MSKKNFTIRDGKENYVLSEGKKEAFEKLADAILEIKDVISSRKGFDEDETDFAGGFLEFVGRLCVELDFELGVKCGTRTEKTSFDLRAGFAECARSGHSYRSFGESDMACLTEITHRLGRKDLEERFRGIYDLYTSYKR